MRWDQWWQDSLYHPSLHRNTCADLAAVGTINGSPELPFPTPVIVGLGARVREKSGKLCQEKKSKVWETWQEHTRTYQSIALGYVSSLALDARRVSGETSVGGCKCLCVDKLLASQNLPTTCSCISPQSHRGTRLLQCDHSMSLIRVFSFGSSPSE